MEELEAGVGSERRGQVESLSGTQLLHLYDLTKRLGALEPIRFPCPRLAAIVSNRRLHSVRCRQTVKCAEYRLRCTADTKGPSAVGCAELSSHLSPQQRPYSIMVRHAILIRRSSAAEARGLDRAGIRAGDAGGRRVRRALLWPLSGPARGVYPPLAFSVVNWVCMAFFVWAHSLGA